MKSAKEDYWAKGDSEEICNTLISYHQKHFSASFNPIWQTWQKNTYSYFSNVLESQSWWTSLTFGGEQGELVQMRIPQARALVRQFVTLICKTKAAFTASAENQNRDVVEDMRISDALLAQIVRDQDVDRLKSLMVEMGCVLGTSFMKTTWRTDKGEVVGLDPETGSMLYAGELEMTCPHVTDMMYDFSIQEWSHNSWAECRVKRNRYDLIAQHPKLEQEILSLPSVTDEKVVRDYFNITMPDDVYVYEFYHRPTPALPNGRMVMYSDYRTVYFDGPNLYETIPIEPFRPEMIYGMGFGYPMLSNLLPAQEMFDHEASCIATNHSAFGVQNIIQARGSDVSVEELLGMNFISYTPQANIPNAGMPQALNLVQDSPNSYKFMDSCLNNMQQMSNINSALRGDIGADASGVAIATLSANALEFMSDYVRELGDVLKKSMFHGINAYRKFVKEPRLVKLVGKNNQTYTKEFKGSNLETIASVDIESVNPMMQTMSGRLDIAEKLAQNGLIKGIDEYCAVLDGQPLSMMTEDDLSESDLMAQENEDMLEGKQVFALATDNHALHIQKHKRLLNDTAVRRTSDRVKLILAHVEEHNQLLKSTDPVLLAAAMTGHAPEGGAPAPEAPPPQGGGEQQGVSQEMGMPAAEGAQPAEDLLGRA